MRREVWILVLAGVAPLACIARQPCPEASPRASSAVATEADVQALLDQTLKANNASRYAEARDLARRALELTKTVRVAPGTLACLHENEGHALWMLNDPDAQDAFQAALEEWERVPGAEEEVARVSQSLAMTLAFGVSELDRAEGLLRRSIELTLRVNPTDTSELLFSYAVLLEVLHQQCRTQDAVPWLEKADALAKSVPADPEQLAVLCRGHANFAESSGDIAGAIEWEKRGLEELTRAESNVLGMVDVAYSRLADLERDRGNYRESLAFVVKRVELAAKKPQSDDERENLPLNLHVAYAAARDPRLAEHDVKYEIVSARAGEPLFPASVPAKEACRPEVRRPPQGRLHRYRDVGERAESCLKDRSRRSQGHPIHLTLRVVSGKVVAAEAVGRLADPGGVRCVADSALGYEHPTDKYTEFSWELVD